MNATTLALAVYSCAWCENMAAFCLGAQANFHLYMLGWTAALKGWLKTFSLFQTIWVTSTTKKLLFDHFNNVQGGIWERSCAYGLIQSHLFSIFHGFSFKTKLLISRWQRFDIIWPTCNLFRAQTCTVGYRMLRQHNVLLCK